MNAAELSVTTHEPAAGISSNTARTAGHIPSLDGLRAVSVLIVFASHSGLGNIAPGGFGVTVFFFLSGFLITTLLRAEYARNGCINFRHFWIRRVLRILPPFYLVLLVATLATALFYPPGSLSDHAVLARAFQFTNYWTIYHDHTGEPKGTGLYWSLAVEEHFYLLFPLVYVGLQRLRLSPARQALLFWGLCAAVLLWRFVLVLSFHASENRIYLASDTRIDSILFGCALAVWHNPVLDRPVLAARWWKYIIIPIAVLALLLSQVISDPLFRDTLRYSLQGAALTFFFAAAIRLHDWGPFRALNWPALAFIGVLSYSLYLVHHTIIFGVQLAYPSVNPLVQAVASFAISMALAGLMYTVVEKPCARLRKRLTD